MKILETIYKNLAADYMFLLKLDFRLDGTQSYSHYFMPPLPKNVVIFSLNKKENNLKEPIEAKISIDLSVEEKFIGELDNKTSCLVTNLNWSEEEKEAEEQVIQNVSTKCMISMKTV